MSIKEQWPLPPWLAQATEKDRVSFYLRLAIAFTETGTPTELANKVGVTPNTIHLAKHRGQCTSDLAIRIEKLHGRELFPRELFYPEPMLPVE